MAKDQDYDDTMQENEKLLDRLIELSRKHQEDALDNHEFLYLLTRELYQASDLELQALTYAVTKVGDAGNW